MADIAYVCTHNQVRSVIAQTLTQDYLRRKKANITVTSFGIQPPLNNRSAPPELLTDILSRYDPSIETWFAQQVDQSALQDSGIVLCMEEKQAEILRQQYPEQKSKIYTLIEYTTGKRQDIADPKFEIQRTFDSTVNKILSAIVGEGLVDNKILNIYFRCIEEIRPHAKKAADKYIRDNMGEPALI